MDSLGQCAAAAQNLSHRPLPVRAITPNLFFWTTAEDSERIFDALADLKVRFIRFDFLWDVIEHSRGEYDWHAYDRFVMQAHEHDMQILAVPLFAPPWANGDGPPQQPPSDVADWAAFVGALVNRYKPCGDLALQLGWTDGYGIRAWEIWNEPNHPLFWTPVRDAAAYTPLLVGAYRVIKTLEPDSVVLNGGLSMPDSGECFSASCYIQKLYASGAKDYFDAMALHPYTKYPPQHIQSSIEAVRAIMDANGDSDKAIWLTEFGYFSSYLTQAGQANYLEQTYNVELPLVAAASNVRMLFWYSLIDSDDESFGLLGTDFSPKQSYYRYRNSILDE